jgi:hypothetical protein
MHCILFHAFLDREFPDHWVRRGVPIPWLPQFSFDSSEFFLAVSVKKCKMLMSCVTELSELQCRLPMKCLPLCGEKVNIIFLCVVPLMVPILKSEHIRGFVRSSV